MKQVKQVSQGTSTLTGFHFVQDLLSMAPHLRTEGNTMLVVGAAKKMNSASVQRIKLGQCAAVAMIVLLASCGGSKDKIASQSLAQVNDSDITVLQLNEEFVRSKVPEAQKEAATKQLLEALIDRQLLQSEALRDKVDRDPQVVQAIERAKSQILTQAYLQKRLINLA